MGIFNPPIAGPNVGVWWHGCHLRRDPVVGAGPVIAALGGAETFGRFMDRPYPDKRADLLGVSVLNLAMLHSGVDSYQHAVSVLDCAHGCAAVVFECPDVRKSSNSYYSVHRSRNDRVIGLHPPFLDMFAGLDMMRVGFVGDLWRRCQRHDPDATGQMMADITASSCKTWSDFVRSFEKPSVTVSFATTASPVRSVDGIDHVQIPQSDEQASLRGFTVAGDDRVVARSMAGQSAHDLAARSLARRLAVDVIRPARGSAYGPLKAS
ncbi:MAG: DUF6473 family protein [Pseudomonadota bacterium]